MDLKLQNRQVESRLQDVEAVAGGVTPEFRRTTPTFTGDMLDSSGITTDYCFVGATKVTIPEKTTNFLKITLGASPAASWVAAMPETQDANSVVFDVTKNRIYLSGEFGGG